MKRAQSFDELYTQVGIRKVAFLVVFFGIVLVTYGILFAVDFIPEPLSEEAKKESEVQFATFMVDTVGGFIGGAADGVKSGVNAINGGLTPSDVEVAPVVEDIVPQTRVVIPEQSVIAPAADVNDTNAVPLSIIIDALNKKVVVKNPTSRTIADLDAALLGGVVRHPDSADFQNPGNIFILGHSSYLPNVFNKNFQAFNGIQELTWGDKIRLQSSDTEYVYRVDRVFKAKASDVVVPITEGEAKLTLATCNSFGSKDDRFVVEATLVSTNSLI